MNLIGIEWDEAKNILNKQEHKLGFEAAQYVFIDPERLERIITARKADKSERRSYNGYYQIDGKGWTRDA
jgi:uncharacterized DUF497 family protein